MRRQLHASAIDDLIKCPYKFRTSTVQGKRGLPSVVQNVGLAVDLAVQFNLHSIMTLGRPAPWLEVESCAKFAIERLCAQPYRLNKAQSKATPEDILMDSRYKAATLAKLHYDELAPKIKPVAIQKGFSIKLDAALAEAGVFMELDLVGQRDIDIVGGVRDLKTSEDEPDPDKAHSSTQLTAYAMALYLETGEPIQNVYLDYVVYGRKGAYVRVLESDRDSADYRGLMHTLVKAARIIEAGVYPARPNRYICNLCPFKKDCEFSILNKKPEATNGTEGTPDNAVGRCEENNPPEIPNQPE